MGPTPATGFDLAATYVQLDDGPRAWEVPATPDFWARIAARQDLQGGRLVAVFPHTEDWPHWERHPAGDEIVYVLSGAIDLVLEEGESRSTVALQPGRAFVIPRGIWHRGIVRVPGQALFVTRGAGTEHRPV